MDNKSTVILELNKIIERLKAYIKSPLGLELIDQATIYTERQQVEYQLRATGEARSLIEACNFSMRGLQDMRPTLLRTRINAMPSILGLLHTASTLRCMSQALRLIHKNSEEAPLINEMITGVEDLSFIAAEIETCIDDNGEVKDSASSALLNIRRQKRKLESQIRSKVEGIVTSSTYSKYLQDNLVTMRQNRYVVPVKLEYRQQVPGIVHDRSASGSTLFIEPMAVVELNNKLREQEQLELREIERILHELGAVLHGYHDQLEITSNISGILDVLTARGLLSLEMDAVEPTVDDAQHFQLFKARHPLIPPNEVVAIDVELGGQYQVLVITGPNTGGKTVTLKLIGLLQLMAQSGLHIPAAENSRIGVFANILADIGDEQSIEQNLSTFSSHMTNINRLLRDADERSLVLFDELGAGTDPVEGAALAMSIIDELHMRGTIVVATTHYSELKAYAYNNDDVVNGSVEFDIETLRPTYRLLIGVPGKSNALLIAERLGVPQEVIAGAAKYISTEEKHVETMITELESNRKQAQADRYEAARLKEQSARLHAEYEKKLATFKLEQEEKQRQAALEAKDYVTRIRAELEAIIFALQEELVGIKDQDAIAASIKAARQLFEEQQQSVKKKADDLYRNPLKKYQKKSKQDHSDQIAKGSHVRHLGWNREGVVVSDLNDKQQFQIQIGSLKMWADLRELEPITKEEPSRRMVTITRSSEPRKLALELDLRGCSILEAEEKVEKYLDDAIMSARSEVFIIHGKGTGALREAVRTLLEYHPYVESIRYGTPSEGGHGITVAKLSK